MIPRILVPKDIRPAAAAVPGAPERRRRSTALDARTLVPADLPVVALDGKTQIPAYVPLEVLAARILVPRDMPVKPLEASTSIPHHIPLMVLETRVAVPRDLLPAAVELRPAAPLARLPDFLEPDVLTTGEVNLLVEPVEERDSSWRWPARVSSIVFHTALIAFALLGPRLFPYRAPTQAEMELARRQLSFVYLPPSIDPRVLRQVAPPTLEPQPLPGAPERERVVRELPAAPTPQLPVAAEPRPRGDAPREQARAEAPKPSEAPGGLVLPRTSPGRALEESIRGASKGGSGTGAIGTSGPMPSGPAGGGGRGFAGSAIQMLTPDEGVDFTNYLTRVLASVRRNWYSVIPESAKMGDRGRVVLQFRILRNGNVPLPEPELMATSGKEPLDRAAASSIRASSPFEPLPSAFSGPYIELRFIFLYNLPLDSQ